MIEPCSVTYRVNSSGFLYVNVNDELALTTLLLIFLVFFFGFIFFYVVLITDY